MRDVKTWLILALIMIFFWFFLTFKITEVPPGINGDESALGYNAALVARTGHDQSGRLLPIFVSAQDLTDWKQPISFYATVLAFKIFGPSYFFLRAVSVIFILISGLVIFLLLKQILGLVYGLFGLFLFVTIPSVMIQAHLGLENIAPVPFVSLWLLMTYKYYKSLNIKPLILGAVFLSFSIFSYSGMRLIMPIYAAISLLLIFFLNNGIRKNVLQHIIYFMLVLTIFPILLLSIRNTYPGAIFAYNRPHMISSYQEFFLPVISSFDLSFLFLKGDSTPYHSTGKSGVFLLASLPLLALGLYKIVIKKNPFLHLILAGFFLTPAFFGLIGSIHRSSRILAFLPFYVVIVTLGFSAILDLKKKILRNFSIILIVILMLLNFFEFISDYWYGYPKRVESEFAKPIHIAFKNLYDESKKSNLTPYMQIGLERQNLIAFKFFEEIYFQDRLKKWATWDLPKSSVILADLAGIKEKGLDERNFKKLDLKNLDYYLLISK